MLYPRTLQAPILTKVQPFTAIPPAETSPANCRCQFGQVSDFEELQRHGVNLSGKIVIVRYGVTFRGLNAQGAY